MNRQNTQEVSPWNLTVFEIYPGTHTSAVAVRFQNHVLPFFSETLCAAESCQ